MGLRPCLLDAFTCYDLEAAFVFLHPFTRLRQPPHGSSCQIENHERDLQARQPVRAAQRGAVAVNVPPGVTPEHLGYAPRDEAVRELQYSESVFS